jgi:hypothetical protein
LRVGSAQALLLREESGHVLRMAPGGTYRGWRLLRIEANGARFRKDGRIMRIGFGASAPAEASALISSASENNSE